MLENEFYKLVTPEGKQNYMLEGQAKMLLLLCQAVDKLIAAQQGVQPTVLTPCDCGGERQLLTRCQKCQSLDSL